MTAATRETAARVGPPPPVGSPPRRSGRNWREWLLAGALLLPNLALLILFTYRPLLDNIRLSFTDYNISAPFANYIGVSNYTEWFTREDTRTIVLNTLVFTVATVVISMGLGLALALLLDRSSKVATSSAPRSSPRSSCPGRRSASRSSSSSTRASV